MYPTLFRVFGIEIRSYGLMLVIGFAVATWVASRRAKRYGVTADQVLDVALIALFAGIVGGRIGWVIQDWDSYKNDWISVFYYWKGGMTYYGGLFLGMLGGAWYARQRKVSFWTLADLLSPSLALGYAITRIGCFLNGCCYGDVCSLPWAVTFPGVPGARHPSQLYATILNLIIFGILLWIERRNQAQAAIAPARVRPGRLFLAFLFLQGVYRFLDEFTRAGSTSSYLVPGVLTVAQVWALGICVVAAALYWWLGRSRTGLRPAQTGTPS